MSQITATPTPVEHKPADPPKFGATWLALQRAYRVAIDLAGRPNHGWVCEECEAPATWVWAYVGTHTEISFGLCDRHSDPADPHAATVRIPS